MDLSKLDDIRINFIVGPGRSGTTLLVHVLNQHKNCITSPEIRHLMYFHRKYRHVTKVTQELLDDYRSYLNMYVQNKVFFMSKLEKTWLDELRVGDEITYARLTKLFYLCLSQHKQDINEINCVIDKNPFYTFYIDELLQLFPSAKVLFMIRDPRAYVLSNRQSQKSRTRISSVYYYAGTWKLHVEKIIEARKRYGDSIRIVTYEDLAMSQEQTIEEIAQFMGLSYTPAMLDFYQQVQNDLQARKLSVEQYERAMKKLRDLSTPINTSRVNAWQEQLLAVDIEKTEFVCWALASQLGYQPAAGPLGLIKKTGHFISSIPARFRLGLFRLLSTPAIDHYLYKKHAKT